MSSLKFSILFYLCSCYLSICVFFSSVRSWYNHLYFSFIDKRGKKYYAWFKNMEIELDFKTEIPRHFTELPQFMLVYLDKEKNPIVTVSGYEAYLKLEMAKLGYGINIQGQYYSNKEEEILPKWIIDEGEF